MKLIRLISNHMPRVLYIILVSGFFFLSQSQLVTDNFKFGYPKFIPEGKKFEVSIVTSKGFTNADLLELELNPADGIQIVKIELKTSNHSGRVNFNQVSGNEPGLKLIKCSINFSKDQFKEQDFFQVMITFTSYNVTSSSIEIKGVFKNGSDVLGYLQSSEPLIQTSKSNIYKADLSFYKASSISAQCLSLDNSSRIVFPVVQKIDNNLYADFWVKLSKPAIEFLSLKNVKTKKVEYSLSTNQFQILSAKSNFHNQIKMMPSFISSEAWHHISILFLGVEGEINFYCNGYKFSTIGLPIVFNPNDYEFEFSNTSNNSTFYIEHFRFINLNEPADNIIRSSNYKNFNSDSSDILLQMNFDNINSFTSNPENLITYQDVKFIKSNAPIFPEAPELNLNILNNYYELTWSGGDVNSAAYYVIESSLEQGLYEKLYEVNAQQDVKIKYSYLAERNVNAGVIYYRVKQVNNDGTAVYSSIVKIGQGAMEDVILGQNYPNPFNPTTVIEFELLQNSDVEVVVYNLEGKEIAILQNGYLSNGIYKFEFDGSDLPSGIYLYKVSTQQFTQTKKMILAK